MTVLSIVKFLHLIIAITAFGLCIASTYYMRAAQKNIGSAIYEYTLTQSLRLDRYFILPLLVITFAFGTGMVHLSGLTTQVPWVRNAYMFLFINLVCWFLSYCIRLRNSKDLSEFKSAKKHLILQLISIVIFLVIIHDAVTQSTWIGN